jgi:hypothetical protein
MGSQGLQGFIAAREGMEMKTKQAWAMAPAVQG